MLKVFYFFIIIHLFLLRINVNFSNIKKHKKISVQNIIKILEIFNLGEIIKESSKKIKILQKSLHLKKKLKMKLINPNKHEKKILNSNVFMKQQEIYELDFKFINNSKKIELFLNNIKEFNIIVEKNINNPTNDKFDLYLNSLIKKIELTYFKNKLIEYIIYLQNLSIYKIRSLLNKLKFKLNEKNNYEIEDINYEGFNRYVWKKNNHKKIIFEFYPASKFLHKKNYVEFFESKLTFIKVKLKESAILYINKIKRKFDNLTK